jgi:V/A-type H+-transporting ATPase subunit A
VLDTGLGARLLRLAQVPAEAIRSAAGDLRGELGAALARLEAE